MPWNAGPFIAVRDRSPATSLNWPFVRRRQSSLRIVLARRHPSCGGPGLVLLGHVGRFREPQRGGGTRERVRLPTSTISGRAAKLDRSNASRSGLGGCSGT